jgi:predicted metalloenzyme YecM
MLIKFVKLNESEFQEALQLIDLKMSNMTIEEVVTMKGKISHITTAMIVELSEFKDHHVKVQVHQKNQAKIHTVTNRKEEVTTEVEEDMKGHMIIEEETIDEKVEICQATIDMDHLAEGTEVEVGVKTVIDGEIYMQT